MQVNVHEAKTHLSALLQRVCAGEEITIARDGVPIARLVPAVPSPAVRPLGLDRGRFEVPDDFDAPLPDDLLAAFYGGEIPEPMPPKQSKRRKQRGISSTLACGYGALWHPKESAQKPV